MRAAGPKNLKFLEGEFQGRKIPMILNSSGRFYEALVGVDLDTKPAKYPIKVRGQDKSGKGLFGALSLEVKKVSFKTQPLSLPSCIVRLIGAEVGEAIAITRFIARTLPKPM